MFKKILAYALTVCLLLSLTVPAYAADEVYTVSDDASALSAPIFYTPDYYPGVVAEMRSSGLFANSIAHGSYSELNYNPSWFYKSGSSYPSGDFNALIPSVTADQTDVSGIYYIPNTTFLSGSLLAFRLPSTDDCYFDFQSSNFLFDQQSPQANTFYINGDLTFSLRNLWTFNGSNGDGVALTDSWYLASDPLAVQLVIDGKAYGDIIDVTSYTSPFTALYNGGVPSNATVTFDNLKVYYQGDTPDMIGFRVYTGSAFTDGQYNYNNAGQFIAVDVTNSVTFRCSEIPDITFVQEGGDGYAGDLSGISGLLSSINTAFQTVISRLTSSNGESWLYRLYDGFVVVKDQWYLDQNGNNVQSTEQVRFSRWLSYSLMGLKKHLADITNTFVLKSGQWYLDQNGNKVQSSSQMDFSRWLSYSIMGIASKLTTMTDKMVLKAGSYTLDQSGSIATTTSDMSLSRWLSFSIIGLKKVIDTNFDDLTVATSQWYLDQSGDKVKATSPIEFSRWLSYSLMGLESSMESEFNALFGELDSFGSYITDTVFPWQSYNMETHQLNAATNITGQNNLFFTAFQSIEDKLGRLAYVFGSDEDLALKDSADPGTDAFRENFGGGASLSDIKDASELTTTIPQIMDSGFDFGDALEEIGSNDDFLKWFTSETWAALDSTGAAVAADPDYLSDYYDNLRKVEEKRHWGD